MRENVRYGFTGKWKRGRKRRIMKDTFLECVKLKNFKPI